MMKKFYEQGGVTISEASMKKEFDTRPVFDLAGQLKIMNRAGGTSDVDKWLTGIGEFMKANGTLPEAPATKSFVTDEYMRMVDSGSEAEGVREPLELSELTRTSDRGAGTRSARDVAVAARMVRR